MAKAVVYVFGTEKYFEGVIALIIMGLRRVTALFIELNIFPKLTWREHLRVTAKVQKSKEDNFPDKLKHSIFDYVTNCLFL